MEIINKILKNNEIRKENRNLKKSCKDLEELISHLKKENEELRLGQKVLINKKVKKEVEKNDNKNISELSTKKSKTTKIKTNKKI